MYSISESRKLIAESGSKDWFNSLELNLIYPYSSQFNEKIIGERNQLAEKR